MLTVHAKLRVLERNYYLSRVVVNKPKYLQIFFMNKTQL